PVESIERPDIRIVNYEGHDYYDGHVGFDGEWAPDATGANSTEYAYGLGVVEFVFPLNSDDPQDLSMKPGMNYQIRLLYWSNVNSGEPTFASSWATLWVPVELY
ncbi:MAG: hypothetical protein DRO87_10955, partial [Candidatus Thorarchaeota archaeon]